MRTGLKISNVCMGVNAFQTGGKLNRQIKELPMGSPASVVLAELTL